MQGAEKVLEARIQSSKYHVGKFLGEGKQNKGLFEERHHVRGLCRYDAVRDVYRGRLRSQNV